jgi:hypothetical protein
MDDSTYIACEERSMKFGELWECDCVQRLNGKIKRKGEFLRKNAGMTDGENGGKGYREERKKKNSFPCHESEC